MNHGLTDRGLNTHGYDQLNIVLFVGDFQNNLTI